MPDDAPMNRRKFFRAGFLELLKPLANAARPLEEIAKQLGNLEDPMHRAGLAAPALRRPDNTVAYNDPGPYVPHDYDDAQEHFLRPPGARPEIEFISICSRCSNCVHACPVNAIQLDHSGARGGGAPFIDPDKAACEMCEPLSCMSNCPSSALSIVTRTEIDLGTAVWNESLCLRTVAGEQCSMCVDHCPVGPSAIHVDENRIIVDEDHCTGCGACQNNCPTTPKSILINPKSKRDEVWTD
ncbi:MAG TPA: 4Fe-4S dicluster domain-containing protein [Humisphaera sp.]|nr:4Fe-4S dicluster domain-containing protein [Humisphaera sp.]